MKRIALFLSLAILSTTTLNAQVASIQNGYYADANGQGFTGKYTEFFESGIMKSEINITQGKVEGFAIYYYENGSKMESGIYLAGLRDGLWEKWSEKGIKTGEANYKVGVKDGMWIVWDEQGSKRMDMHYISGQKSGKWLMWDEKGILSGERIYSDAQ